MFPRTWPPRRKASGLGSPRGPSILEIPKAKREATVLVAVSTITHSTLAAMKEVLR
jgi:hypothetical protein